MTDAQIDSIMEQAQVFASAWSLVGGPFDSGGMLETAEQEKAALRALLASKPAVPFQERVQPWMLECFGAEIAADRIKRNHRFFEEATEAVQANGMTRSEAHQLVDYTFDRPVGELHQEVGGVMVTLAALCLASGQDMHAAGETELARIWTKVEQIRAKQAAKPKHSPLPTAPAQPCGDAEQADAPQAVEQWQFRVKDVGSPLWTNITHADANELSSNPAFELRALSLVSPLPRAYEPADEAVTLPTIPAIPMTQDELNELPDWIKNARPPEAV